MRVGAHLECRIKGAARGNNAQLLVEHNDRFPDCTKAREALVQSQQNIWNKLKYEYEAYRAEIDRRKSGR